MHHLPGEPEYHNHDIQVSITVWHYLSVSLQLEG
jgi:hypothetical protein